MLTNGKAALYGILVGILVGIGAAVAFLGTGTTTTVQRTRVVYRTAPAPRRLVVPPVAAVRTLYAVRTDTVLVRVAVPADLDLVGVVGPTPLDFADDLVRLRYWSPDSLRWLEDEYRLRRPRFGWGVLAGGGLSAGGAAYVSTEIEARLGRFSASLGPAATSRGVALAFGIRYRLLGIP